MNTKRNTRLIKWLGDPPMVGKDGWSVPNWRYENRRVIALPWIAWRRIDQSDLPGLSRSYQWDKRLPDYLLEVDEADALLILAACPNEFRDVTHEAYPEFVKHEPIVMLRAPDGTIKVKQGDREILRTRSRAR